MYTGQGRFHGSTTSTLKDIVGIANVTVENLRNVSDYLDSAQRVGVDANSLAPNVQNEIDSLQVKINNAANLLSTAATDNARDIRYVLEAV